MPFRHFMDETPLPPDETPPPPTHLQRIWHVAGAFGRRDPSLFIAIFALWVLVTGVSLTATSDAFSKSSIYNVARELGLNDNYVGLTMIGNSVALIWGLGNMPPRIRASISLLTGVLWMFWSVITFLGAWRAGFYSASAAWTLLSSLALMRTTSVNITHDYPHNGGNR